MQNEAFAVADALGAAIEARSPEMLRQVYGEDMQIWHNPTGQAMSGAENIGLLEKIFAITSQLKYIDIRRYPIEGGLVQQHQLVGTFSDGKPMPALHACLVIKVSDGKIRHIDEYFDSQTFAEVWQRLAESADAS